jgi:hypothetical protein
MTGKFICVLSVLFVLSQPLWSVEKDEILKISNETGFTMSALYISDTNLEDWGNNLLGENPLLSGESLSIPLIKLESLYIDIRGRDNEGDTYTVYNINAEMDDVIITLNNIDPD